MLNSERPARLPPSPITALRGCRSARSKFVVRAAAQVSPAMPRRPRHLHACLSHVRDPGPVRRCAPSPFCTHLLMFPCAGGGLWRYRGRCGRAHSAQGGHSALPLPGPLGIESQHTPAQGWADFQPRFFSWIACIVLNELVRASLGATRDKVHACMRCMLPCPWRQHACRAHMCSCRAVQQHTFDFYKSIRPVLCAHLLLRLHAQGRFAGCHSCPGRPRGIYQAQDASEIKATTG